MKIQAELRKILNDDLGEAGYLSATADGWNFIYEGFLTEKKIRALAQLGYFVSQIDTGDAEGNVGHVWLSRIYGWDETFSIKQEVLA